MPRFRIRFSCFNGKRRASTYAIGVSAPRNNHSEPANTTSLQSTLPFPTNFESRKDLSASRNAGTRHAAAIKSQYGRDFFEESDAGLDTLRSLRLQATARSYFWRMVVWVQ